MLSNKAKNELKAIAGITEDCDFQIDRKSKWVVHISLTKGLCLFAKFKFHCKNHTMDRII